MNTPELNWFKSSYSGGEGDNCVEVAMRPGAIHIRDSKDTSLRPLTVSPTAWAAFNLGLIGGR
ncbi:MULTISPECIES: DUF397 domain-containing protein [unclassified Streptomyces]|uniref:DUF397 domain-containing protein n=1 Tax=unclassified Streptomyces TaxID=2593676 RepID=UPI002DD8AF7C|nr:MULTISPECIES: DUF397 domain-containing protein [unclassified Streptomyces]WSA94626.1 DUF397 domain-containing protein [Streptomyces sp. NBC_01795]WSB79046.1 DUF397 domain-containing protein [Streptomyces sp. NBC_01775]WSS41537.1 DUF397 domain-containing protein [Streptomyces sp. NBC_01187]